VYNIITVTRFIFYLFIDLFVYMYIIS
jgi:hypothetical protein